MEILSPKPKVINTDQGVSIKLEWSQKFIKNANRIFEPGGELQKYVDATILESIEPYLPFDTGSLSASARLHTVIGSGKLIWQTPYARYLYYGLLMVDPTYKVGAFHDPVTGRFWSRRGIPKVKTDIPLKFRGGGKRGSRWVERWISDNLTSFEKNLNKKAGELLRR